MLSVVPSPLQRGMSLIEVMVVVFIIGLSAGVVVLTLPTSKSAAEQAGETFASVIQEAQERAIMSGYPIGLQFTESGYAVLHWRQNDWRAAGRPKTLDSAVEISLRSEALPERRRDVPENWPEIIFDPTGVNTALEFRIDGRRTRVDVTISETGEVSLETR